jgi:hypothetical protein
MADSGFAGKWNTDFGPLEIQVNGVTAVGEYGSCEGELKGTVCGTVLRGRWSQLAAEGPGITWGECVLTLTGLGESFNGTWTYLDGTPPPSKNTWAGKRTAIFSVA